MDPTVGPCKGEQVESRDKAGGDGKGVGGEHEEGPTAKCSYRDNGERFVKMFHSSLSVFENDIVGIVMLEIQLARTDRTWSPSLSSPLQKIVLYPRHPTLEKPCLRRKAPRLGP